MAHGSTRPVHLFDAWQGLPEATEKDGEGGKQWSGDVVGSLARVRSVMLKLKIPPDRIILHKGWFSDTFPHAGIDTVALAHIDADFYEPVRLSIETWYPKLSVGGFMQFDDYTAFIGCKRAVDEFLDATPSAKLLNIDGTVFFIRKPS